MNIIKTEAWSINSTESWKQQTKQVFLLSWVFLASLLPGHTEAPYSCLTGPVPSQSQTWNPLPLCIHPLISLLSWNKWCSMQLCTSLTHHCMTLQWCHTRPLASPCDTDDEVMLFLVGNPCACILMMECWNRSPLFRACLLVHPYSPYFQGVINCNPRCTLWHIYWCMSGYPHTYSFIHTCIHIHIYKLMNVWAGTRTYMWAYIHTDIHKYIQACIFSYLCAYMESCFPNTHIQTMIFVYKHAYIHT